MDEHLKQEILKILRAVEIHSAGSFLFGGHIVFADKDEAQSSGSEQNPLVDHLTRQLYFHCYSRKFAEAPAVELRYPREEINFVNKLSEANAGRETQDRGWVITCLVPTGHYLLQKNGATRALSAEEFVADDSSTPLRVGSSVGVICPKESRTMHRSFYFIFGQTIADQQDDEDLLRFYWNINSKGVEHLVRLLTRRLNRFQIPFRLKCLNDPEAYQRSDAAVLYINRRFYRLLAELLVQPYLRVEEFLAPDTPLFSKQLALGLGLAEEPGNGESFGQQRCRILAEGIWSSWKLNLQSEQEKLNEVARQFELNGLTLDRPYLNPGSVDQYEFCLDLTTAV